jgi:four helix bundle protein
VGNVEVVVMPKMDSEQFQNYRFEKLEVWQLGMRIVHEVYKITRKFPREELFALTDQFKRAATSIVFNIAEGSGQSSSKSFCLYINRSKSSTLECVACRKLALQENFISSEDTLLESMLKEEYFKLIALEKSLRK